MLFRPTHTFMQSPEAPKAGKTLALRVSPQQADASFSICIANDLIATQGIKTQPKLRFALCEEDKQQILQDPNQLDLTADSLQILASTDIRLQTRRSHGLLGQFILANLALIKYQGCELYVDPYVYKFPSNFRELKRTVGDIKAQLEHHLPDNFNDWKDDDYEYEDDERDE